LNNSKNIISIEFIFESVFDTKLENIPDVLYHICKSNKIDNILNHHILYNSKNLIDYHQDRIYFILNDNMIDYYHNLYLLTDIKNNKIGDYTCLIIKNNNFNLYHDPNNWDNTCYTYNIITNEHILEVKYL
jgi:hypothetical protein